MNILVVIDMQNDFIDGVLGNAETKDIVSNVCKIIEIYKKKNPYLPIFCTYDTHEENYLETQEGKKLPIPHCIYKTEGWKLNEKINTSLGDNRTEVIKETFGAIHLMNIILNNFEEDEIDKIIICGVCTDICVISNAMILKAAFPEIKIEVVEDCCAGTTPESHARALEAMEVCQIDIVNMEDLI